MKWESAMVMVVNRAGAEFMLKEPRRRVSVLSRLKSTGIGEKVRFVALPAV